MTDTSPSQARRQVGFLAIVGVFARIVGQAMALGLLLLAGRFLTVELFGIFVLGSILMNFGVMQMYSGVYQFVLREPTFETSRGTAFTLQMVYSLIFALIILAAALFAYLVGWGSLLALIMASTAGVPIICLISSWQEAVLLREGDVKYYYGALIATEMCGFAGGVLMLLNGQGVWALIANRYIADSLMAVALTLKNRSLPRPAWSREHAREIFSFASPLYGNTALAFFSSSGADIVLGGFMSARAVGLFRMGSRTATAAFDLFAQTFRVLTWQAVGRKARERRLSADLWTSLLTINLSVMIFVLGSLSILAHELTALLLGGEWMAMVPVLQVLCWVRVITSADQILSAQLAAAGHTGHLFRARLIEAGILLLSLLITVQFGIIAVAFGLFAPALVYVWIQLSKLAGLSEISKRRVVMTALPGIGLGFASLAIVFATASMLSPHGGLVTLLGTAVIGAATYTLLAFIVMRAWTLDVLHTVSTAILPARTLDTSGGQA